MKEKALLQYNSNNKKEAALTTAHWAKPEIGLTWLFWTLLASFAVFALEKILFGLDHRGFLLLIWCNKWDKMPYPSSTANHRTLKQYSNSKSSYQSLISRGGEIHSRTQISKSTIVPSGTFNAWDIFSRKRGAGMNSVLLKCQWHPPESCWNLSSSWKTNKPCI